MCSECVTAGARQASVQASRIYNGAHNNKNDFGDTNKNDVEQYIYTNI